MTLVDNIVNRLWVFISQNSYLTEKSLILFDKHLGGDPGPKNLWTDPRHWGTRSSVEPIQSIGV